MRPANEMGWPNEHARWTAPLRNLFRKKNIGYIKLIIHLTKYWRGEWTVYTRVMWGIARQLCARIIWSIIEHRLKTIIPSWPPSPFHHDSGVEKYRIWSVGLATVWMCLSVSSTQLMKSWVSFVESRRVLMSLNKSLLCSKSQALNSDLGIEYWIQETSSSLWSIRPSTKSVVESVIIKVEQSWYRVASRAEQPAKIKEVKIKKTMCRKTCMLSERAISHITICV